VILQNRIHPLLWPLQLLGSVLVFTAFLGVIAALFWLLAVRGALTGKDD
jgi:hypothetical protein